MTRLLLAALAVALVFASGVSVGRYTKRPVVVTKVETKWAKSEQTAAATSAVVEKKQSVRVVTKWLRPDGTPLKLQLRETGSLTSVVSSTVQERQSDASAETARVYAPATADRPRLHVGAMLGLDLRTGAERRWGAYATYRVAGGVAVGAWALPGLRVGGASLGVTF